MHVLVFHGYLLRGTGSNVYNAELAQALSRAGHEVHLLCQDREAAALPWVDAVGDWDGGALRVESTPGGSSPGRGSITAYRPDIGDLLPVYVEDRYAGFRVKAFPALSDDEVDRYVAANVNAVRDLAARVAPIDAALANHLIMGPAILARAGLGAPQGPGFAAKIHGSALSYVVRPHRRFLPLAREGAAAASGVLVGSDHVARSLWETLRDSEIERKTRLGPPGVDTGLFAPAGPGRDASEQLEGLAGELRRTGGGEGPDDSFRRDPAAAASAIERFAAAATGRVAFVGKLIASKGCELLLAAWPLIVARTPGARLALVGFGSFRPPLERLWELLGAGRLDEARELATRGRALEDPAGEPRPLAELAAFLAEPPAGYERAAAAARGTVELTGRLEHREVARLLRGCDALVVPSTFPEAFGMVAAEAAAAGVLPICAAHSGLAEVAGALARELGPDLGKLASFEIGPGAVMGIADRVSRWLALPVAERRVAGEALRLTASRLWGWEGVARTVLAASAGDLDQLPRPAPLDPRDGRRLGASYE